MNGWLKALIRREFSRRGYGIVRMPPRLCEAPQARLELTFDHVLCHYLMNQPRTPFFVQVGAFDGVSGDQLYPYTRRGLLRGCLVEPQADAFERLRANYAAIDGVLLKRAAIADRPGQATLYRIRPGAEGPPWLHQIASFHRDVLMSHAALVPDLEQAIVTEVVPTITFGELFAEVGAEPDIVAIDTEGHDFELIKLLDVPARRPAIILYEHRHLSRADQDACVDLLLGVGYLLATSWTDTVAYLPPGPS